MKSTIPMMTLEITIKAPIENVWKLWNTPTDIMQWNNPTDDWHNPHAKVDLRDGGEFLFRMEIKNSTVGFDFGGKYDKVITNELIEFTGDDGRKTINTFTANGHETTITETFEPNPEDPIDMQRDFCQGVLNNFKRYAERKN